MYSLKVTVSNHFCHVHEDVLLESFFSPEHRHFSMIFVDQAGSRPARQCFPTLGLIHLHQLHSIKSGLGHTYSCISSHLPHGFNRNSKVTATRVTL
jgi:hypothetical protein